LNRFIELVPFLKRFIQTGFYLGNRFKVNKDKIKDPKLRLNLKYFWENWFQNCFFNKTGSKTEPIPINRFKNGTGLLKNRFWNRFMKPVYQPSVTSKRTSVTSKK
jgi:hypothetical protein